MATCTLSLASVGLSLASGGFSLEPPPAHTFPPYTPRDYFKFEVTHESKKPGSRARLGRIHTPHGIIDTPGFVPVGTSAALKGVTNDQAVAAGVQLMFCNTYHLMVHPGSEIVAAAGGLHRYMGRSGPIITDSGGFQVFSLAPKTDADGPELKARSKSGNQATLTSVTEEGVRFRSYFDSSEILLTPESSVLAQKDLGGDIIIPLDELPPYYITRERLEQSVALSHRWIARSLRQHLSDPREQAMYAVVHGGTDAELRRASASYLASLPFDGFALGGSLGRDTLGLGLGLADPNPNPHPNPNRSPKPKPKPKPNPNPNPEQDTDEMLGMLGLLMPALPRDKPNHLLGIADERSVRGAVALGVDTFDSCLPTRNARHGTLITRAGTIHIGQGKYKRDFGPIDPTLETIGHSRAYLHHLYRVKEPLFAMLASQHNLHFMGALVAELREQIAADEI